MYSGELAPRLDHCCRVRMGSGELCSDIYAGEWTPVNSPKDRKKSARDPAENPLKMNYSAYKSPVPAL